MKKLTQGIEQHSVVILFTFLELTVYHLTWLSHFNTEFSSVSLDRQLKIRVAYSLAQSKVSLSRRHATPTSQNRKEREKVDLTDKAILPHTPRGGRGVCDHNSLFGQW